MPAKPKKIDASEWTQQDWTELYQAIDRVSRNVRHRHSGLSRLVHEASEQPAQSPGSGEAERLIDTVLLPLQFFPDVDPSVLTYARSKPLAERVEEIAHWMRQQKQLIRDYVALTETAQHQRERIDELEAAHPPSVKIGDGNLREVVTAHIADLECVAVVLDGHGAFAKTAAEVRVAVGELRTAISAAPIGDGKDGERLDYMERRSKFYADTDETVAHAKIEAVCMPMGHKPKPTSLRAAIDAAMQADAGREEK